MSKATLLRGAAAAGLLGVGLLATSAAADNAPFPPGGHFRAIKVDVSPLLHNSGEPTAGWMAGALSGPLHAAFGSRLAPGDPSAPTLVIRIDTVFLGQSGAGILDAAGADLARDHVQGAGIVVAPNGRTIASYPIFDVIFNWTGGSNYEVGSEHRRINELAVGVAHWLPGQMGL